MDLREKVARLECPAFDDCSNEIKAVLLGRADRAIATVFEHLENVTPEMAEAGEDVFEPSYTGTPVSTPREVFLAMLAAARKDTEK